MASEYDFDSYVMEHRVSSKATSYVNKTTVEIFWKSMENIGLLLIGKWLWKRP